MSTKASINTKIAGRTSGGENPISTERALWTDVNNELFPTLIDVLSSETTYAIPNIPAQFPYELVLSKNGGRVSINGRVRNAVVDLSNTVLLTLTDTEILVSMHQVGGAAAKYRCKARNPVSGVTITLVLQSNILRVEGSFPSSITGNAWYEILEPLQYNTEN